MGRGEEEEGFSRHGLSLSLRLLRSVPIPPSVPPRRNGTRVGQKKKRPHPRTALPKVLLLDPIPSNGSYDPGGGREDRNRDQDTEETLPCVRPSHRKGDGWTIHPFVPLGCRKGGSRGEGVSFPSPPSPSGKDPRSNPLLQPHVRGSGSEATVERMMERQDEGRERDLAFRSASRRKKERSSRSHPSRERIFLRRPTPGRTDDSVRRALEAAPFRRWNDRDEGTSHDARMACLTIARSQPRLGEIARSSESMRFERTSWTRRTASRTKKDRRNVARGSFRLGQARIQDILVFRRAQHRHVLESFSPFTSMRDASNCAGYEQLQRVSPYLPPSLVLEPSDVSPSCLVLWTCPRRMPKTSLQEPTFLSERVRFAVQNRICWNIDVFLRPLAGGRRSVDVARVSMDTPNLGRRMVKMTVGRTFRSIRFLCLSYATEAKQVSFLSRRREREHLGNLDGRMHSMDPRTISKVELGPVLVHLRRKIGDGLRNWTIQFFHDPSLTSLAPRRRGSDPSSSGVPRSHGSVDVTIRFATNASTSSISIRGRFPWTGTAGDETPRARGDEKTCSIESIEVSIPSSA